MAPLNTPKQWGSFPSPSLLFPFPFPPFFLPFRFPSLSLTACDESTSCVQTAVNISVESRWGNNKGLGASCVAFVASRALSYDRDIL